MLACCHLAASPRRVRGTVLRNFLTAQSSKTRCAAWYDFSGSSRRIRGSSRGRFSFPIHVSSSFCFPAILFHPVRVYLYPNWMLHPEIRKTHSPLWIWGRRWLTDVLLHTLFPLFRKCLHGGNAKHESPQQQKCGKQVVIAGQQRWLPIVDRWKGGLDGPDSIPKP